MLVWLFVYCNRLSLVNIGWCLILYLDGYEVFYGEMDLCSRSLYIFFVLVWGLMLVGLLQGFRQVWCWGLTGFMLGLFQGFRQAWYWGLNWLSFVFLLLTGCVLEAQQVMCLEVMLVWHICWYGFFQWVSLLQAGFLWLMKSSGLCFSSLYIYFTWWIFCFFCICWYIFFWQGIRLCFKAWLLCPAWQVQQAFDISLSLSIVLIFCFICFLSISQA